MGIYRVQDLRTGIDERYQNGVKRGLDLGFKSLRDIFSVKIGTTLYLYGPPTVGKTEFKYQMLINLSKFYGLKHAVYDPETGSAVDISEQIIEAYAESDFHNEYENKMSPASKMSAEAFVDEFFFIVDTGMESMTIESFYDSVKSIEHTFDVKINTTSIDPWNEVLHDYGPYGGRDDKYLEWALSYVRRQAVQNEWYNIIVTHVRDQQLVRDGDLYYYPPCMPRDVSKGQVWFQKGMAMIGMWRPKFGLLDNNGVPYEKNEVLIMPHKQKPKGVAVPFERPDHASIYFDAKRHCYYDKCPVGVPRYSEKLR